MRRRRDETSRTAAAATNSRAVQARISFSLPVLLPILAFAPRTTNALIHSEREGFLGTPPSPRSGGRTSRLRTPRARAGGRHSTTPPPATASPGANCTPGQRCSRRLQKKPPSFVSSTSSHLAPSRSLADKNPLHDHTDASYHRIRCPARCDRDVRRVGGRGRGADPQGLTPHQDEGQARPLRDGGHARDGRLVPQDEARDGRAAVRARLPTPSPAGVALSPTKTPSKSSGKGPMPSPIATSPERAPRCPPPIR